ncbi:MAG: biotin--[acetyl-CoA-carboxylase] ligase [Leptolyngbyaceae cyanobacterium]
MTRHPSALQSVHATCRMSLAVAVILIMGTGLDYQRLLVALDRLGTELGSLPQLAMLKPSFQISLYETLLSTNTQAWALIDQGQGAGTVVIAQQQTAGRGQWGRTWVSPLGGLYLSLVLEPALPAEQSHLLTLTSAWGVAIALHNLGLPVEIKWPNDLVSAGRKVGGLLTESRLSQSPTDQSPGSSQIQFAVVGLGLNWDNPLPKTALSVRQLLPDRSGAPVKTLEDLAAIALRGLWQGYYYWQQWGDQSFVNAYQQRLAHVGKQVTLNGHPVVVKGVSIKGELIVHIAGDDPKRVRYLKPGEISLGYNV